VAAKRDMMYFALEAQAGRGGSRHVAILARRLREMQIENLTIVTGFTGEMVTCRQLY
jgi:hypothetical protein